MEELLRQLLWGCLQAVGLFHNKTPIPVDPVTGLPHIDIGLLPLYYRWLAESLAVLKDFCKRSRECWGNILPCSGEVAYKAGL